jgi:hypothetical protein
MTRDEAVNLLQAFFKSYGLARPGLNENNLGGAMIGDGQIYFEYRPDCGRLKCSALIYRFKTEPRPRVLQEFRREEAAGTFDRGGGSIEYEAENCGLYLSCSYTDPVSPSDFTIDRRRLSGASCAWGRTALDRVASRASCAEGADGAD